MVDDNSGATIAIGLLSSSIDGLRSELSSGLSEIRTRLDNKMDKSDGTAITLRLDRMELDTDRRLDSVEAQLRDEKTIAAAVLADQRKRWTVREHVGSTVIAILTLIGLVFIQPWLASTLFAGHHP